MPNKPYLGARIGLDVLIHDSQKLVEVFTRRGVLVVRIEESMYRVLEVVHGHQEVERLDERSEGRGNDRSFSGDNPGNENQAAYLHANLGCCTDNRLVSSMWRWCFMLENATSHISRIGGT